VTDRLEEGGAVPPAGGVVHVQEYVDQVYPACFWRTSWSSIPAGEQVGQGRRVRPR